MSPRQRGKQRARELRVKWGNPNLPIIDLSNEIYSQTGVWVVRLRLGVEVDGGIFGRGETRVMVINTRDRGLGKQRATAAHELGHYLEDQGGEFAELIDQSKPAEAFAEGFAIELLAPEDGVREWLRNQGLDRQEIRASHASQLASYFRISYEMACRHLQSIGAVASARRDELIGQGGRAAAYEGAVEAWYDENVNAKNAFELPAAYVGRARTAFSDGLITVERLAELEFRDIVEMHNAMMGSGLLSGEAQTKPSENQRTSAATPRQSRAAPR